MTQNFSLSAAFGALALMMGLQHTAAAQCAAGETEVVVEILTDNYPGEITWTLSDANGTLLSGGPYSASGTTYTDGVCIDGAVEFPCLQFVINDSYGDGICCGYGNGAYTLYMDGAAVATGGNYGQQDIVQFDCAPGATCNDALALTEADYGTVTQVADNFWYTFTPPANGMYTFSSCGAACNTTLYVYDYCNMGNFDNTNEGSIYYDDNQGGCGEEATLTMLLEGNTQYWIRFASNDGSCGGGFDWAFDYAGPPTGCTDATACNYNPSAEVDNGSCVYEGDPLCTGPDLVVLESAITSSLTTATMNVNQTDCYIEEGCLNGFGSRQLIRFTTHIKNIGELDYYIGTTSQTDQTQQFEWGACHNHWHYKGYAKYDLYTMDGGLIPIGFKNGFCVMDLECGDGGTFTYGCSNMGISAGCGDIYSSGLSCQWIDVTDVEDGQYRLVVRVNWDYDPDALGRYETNTENNWAVVCIEIDRSSGFAVNIITDCPTFTDCSGTPFGTALIDCNGECGGVAMVGDLNDDLLQDLNDAQAYVEGVLGGDLTPAPCNDINADGSISLADATFMADCQFWNEAHTHPDSSGVHSHCEFPVNDITNPFDTTHFTIASVDWDNQTFDVHVKNPDARIYGYQLQFDGVQISQTESLLDPAEGYTGTPSHAPGGDQVLTLSYDGMTVPKHTEYVPLLRVHWIGNANGMVCIAGAHEVMNDYLQKTLINLDNPCQEQTTQTCPGDMDGDGVVTVSDVLDVLSEFGCVEGCVMDINGDGSTNVTDVLAVLSAFGTAC